MAEAGADTAKPCADSGAGDVAAAVVEPLRRSQRAAAADAAKNISVFITGAPISPPS